jgi:cell wall-associated NlpC family hydrolase
MNKRTTRVGAARPAVHRIAWSAVICTTLCVLIIRPAYADPTNPGRVPDAGLPPIATAPLNPGNGVTGVPAGTFPPGSFEAQYAALQSQVELLGERLTKLGIEVTAAQESTQRTYQAWLTAHSQAVQLQQRADNAAANAYKRATELGPWSGYANDVAQLGALAPGLGQNLGQDGDEPGTQTAVQDAARAANVERDALAAYRAAQAAEQRLLNQQAALINDRNQHVTELADLTAKHTAEVAAAKDAQDAADQRLLAQFNPGVNSKDLIPNPIAVAAVNAALSKRGSPYVWGDEGPGTFDCSGLVLWSYEQAGFHGMPRIAGDQYHATRPIAVEDLIMGDLVFFNPTSRTDWTTISHVGIYLGNGLMIEAPSAGDVVKIAPVWWSAFYGATRVVPATPKVKATQPANGQTGGAQPSGSQPTKLPSAGPSSSSSSSPSTGPSNTPSSQPSTSPTPGEPSPTPSETASPSPSISNPTRSQSPSNPTPSSDPPRPSPSDNASNSAPVSGAASSGP